MQLYKYLSDNAISVADFAKQIGAGSRATVYRYINGNRRMPSKRIMNRIIQATDGAVTANDFYEAYDKSISND